MRTPITIKKTIENIHIKEYLLPAIQREFVWSTDQIEELFDSIMCNYPIGSFLFWKVSKEKKSEFEFYEFIRNYHVRDNYHNPKADLSGTDRIVAILDGQQRLTSFYLGCRGSYAEKIPRKRWDNDLAFPRKKLYLNLLEKSKKEDYGHGYNFKFLTLEKAKYRDKNTCWFKVGDILNFDGIADVTSYIMENDLDNDSEVGNTRIAGDILSRLLQTFHIDPVIHYFLEEDQELNKVLNIFIRVNSGGTKLSYSDLLLSIASAQWKKKDAREEINNFVDEINQIGDGFDFGKDFILKSSLILCDFTDIAFKVDNFKKRNMLMIENSWSRIKISIRLAINLISSFGYQYNTLTSHNAIIPIAYYLYKKEPEDNFISSNKYLNDRQRIQKWLQLSLVKRVFSGQPDNVLRPIRQEISNKYEKFPIIDIIQKFKGTNKSLVFNDEDIESLMFYRYGQKHTFSVLALCYPTFDFRNKFHVDHIFPRSLFRRNKLRKLGINDESIEFFMDNFNYPVNLQLLEGIQNQEKSNMNFDIWLDKNFESDKQRREYREKHLIPDIDLGIHNFEEFVNEREILLCKEYKEILT